VLAHEDQGLCIARIDARSTHYAELAPEGAMAVLHDVHALRTALKAHPAANAPTRENLYFGLGLERLWVVTPKAPQVTALEKHCRPNARTVVDGKALNVGYNP